MQLSAVGTAPAQSMALNVLSRVPVMTPVRPGEKGNAGSGKEDRQSPARRGRAFWACIPPGASNDHRNRDRVSAAASVRPAAEERAEGSHSPWLSA